MVLWSLLIMTDPRKEFEQILLAQRVASRVLAQEALVGRVLARVAGKPTFEKARAEVWGFFDKEGWQTSNPGLKVPHITSPDGNTRLWFKPQAVYYTVGKHDLGSARSLHIDIRDSSPEQIMKSLQRVSGV